MKIRTIAVVAALTLAGSALAQEFKWPVASHTNVAAHPPLKSHVQRFLDSSQSAGFQSYPRTLRALHRTKYNPVNNTFSFISGNGYWVYAAGDLLNGGRPLSKSGGRGEWVLDPSSPGGAYDREAPGSGWPAGPKEGNYFLDDFDIDERGNHYLAYTQYGWGILNSSLQLQWNDKESNPTSQRCSGNCPDNSKMVVGRVGNEFYAIVGGPAWWGVWNVTTPTNPQFIRSLNLNAELTRNGDGSKILAVGIGKAVVVHNLSDLVGGSTSGTSTNINRTFLAAGFDGDHFWFVPWEGGALYRATQSGQASSIPIAGGTLPSQAKWIAGGADFVAVGDGNSWIRVYRVSSGIAEEQTGVTQYSLDYYARVGEIFHRHMLPFAANGKTYFIWSANAVGDVYEVQGGDTLTVARDATASLGTKNTRSPNQNNGPYYGDLVTFKATFTGTSVPNQIKWSFDSGMPFGPGQGLTDPATHRYTGSSTTAKTVRAEDVNRPDVFGQTSQTILVPKPRVLVPGTSELIEAGKSLGKLVSGSVFYDASDGVVEGHSAGWKYSDAAEVIQGPLEAFGVGAACEDRTLAFTARYDGYTPPSITMSYTVRPFVVSSAIGTVTTESVTFNNTTTVGTGFDGGAQWTETWELLDAVGTVLASQGGTPTTLGTKSLFSVLKSLIPSTGGKIRLTIKDVSGLPAGCESFTQDSVEIPLEKPDPEIVTSLCQSPTTQSGSCSLSVKSFSNGSTSGWTYQWYLNGSATGVTSTTYSPTFSSAGTHSVTVRATNPFGFTEATKVLEVTTPPCSGVPPQDRLTFTSTQTGARSFEFQAIMFQSSYQFQDCDTFAWNFGDGTTGSGLVANKTFPADGTYQVTLTVTNPNGSVSTTKSHVVGTATPPPTQPPPTTCANPQNQVYINFIGSQSGCAPGLGKPPCNVGEVVTFSIDTMPTFSLATCHTQTWQFGAGASPPSSTARTVNVIYAAAGTRTVTLAVSNGSVTSTTPATVTTQPTTCGTTAPSDLRISYSGLTSGCFSGSSVPCKEGETFRFSITPGGSYNMLGCETVSWNLGDGTTSSSKDPFNHAFAGVGPYTVTLNVANTHGSSSTSAIIRFFDPTVPKPAVTISPKSVKAKLGSTVSFVGTAQTGADHPLVAHEWRVIRATGGDTLVRTVANQGAITHTFNELGDYRVEYTATNAGGVSTPDIAHVTVALVQEYSFIIPVVAHLPGQGGTEWRTDLHIFNTDPLLGPLEFEYEFRGGAATITKAIVMTSSTQIYEDFLGELSKPFPSLVDAGPVLVKARGDSPPQIWTRTYTVDATGNGTYGQFIPAVSLDGAAQSDGLTNTYILPGLEISERFRTNVGIVNPSASTVTVNVMARDHTPLGVPLGNFDVQVPPFALVQIGDLPQRIPGIKEHPFSLNIRPIGNTPIVVYGSMIDSRSNDPVFVTGVREVDQEGTDKQVQILPGAGRIEQADGTWRSDVVVYNADLLPIKFDVIYYDSSGTRVAEAKDQVLGNGAFIKVEDVLKWSKFDVDPGDSFGKIKVVTNLSANPVVRFPIVFERTYKDRGELGSFGQGIPAISPDEANVTVGQAAYLAGVRADCSFYTNLGLIAIGEEPSHVKVTLLDDVTGLPVGEWRYTVDGEPAGIMPNASVIAPNIIRVISSVHDRGTLKIEVLSGGDVWAYASVIAAADPSRGCSLPEQTFDPEYIPAVKMPMP